MSHRYVARSLAVLVLIAGLIAVGCTNPATSPTAPGGGAAAPSVTIANFAFSPADISVKVGATVTWTNNDTATHTVTADDNSWTSQGLNQGATYSHTFTAAGTFKYHCSIHPTMMGTVTVTS